MDKQHFSITIDATPEKIWELLWDKDTYPIWTRPFSENSTAVTDWKKGSKVLFLDGNERGMVSVVAENIPNQFMSIEHLGLYKDGVEDLESEEVKEWKGAQENYTLKPLDGQTELRIEMDINEKYKEMFAGIWPKALQEVKKLAEK